MEYEDALLFLQNNYHREGNLSLLSIGSGKAVFRVQCSDGDDLVLRVQGRDNQGAMLSVAAILLMLQSKGYPAEQVCWTINGSSVAIEDERCGLLTTYLGESIAKWRSAVSHTILEPEPESDPVAYYGLGAALGRLHRLPVSPNVSLAGMLPESELAFADSCLKAIAGKAPNEWQPLYERLSSAVATLHLGDDLPAALLHNDCHLGNAVHTPDGRVALVDWEGAGRGPAVIDLGFLLSQCCQGSLQRPNPDCVAAVVAGYQQHRQITIAERYRLVDAIRFRTLVLLAATFPRRITADYDLKEALYGRTYEDWLARYDATEEIATLVCR